jgi:hypothetical protein
VAGELARLGPNTPAEKRGWQQAGQQGRTPTPVKRVGKKKMRKGMAKPARDGTLVLSGRKLKRVTNLGNLARQLTTQRQYSRALPLLEEAADICETAGHPAARAYRVEAAAVTQKMQGGLPVFSMPLAVAVCLLVLICTWLR